MKRRHRRNSLVLAALGVSFVVPAVRGQTVNWTGNNSNLWTDGLNWNGGSAPGSGSIGLFNAGGGATNISLGGTTQTVGAIQFDTSSAAAYTLGTTSGDAFNIAQNNITSTIGAIAVTSGVTSAQEIDASIAFTNTSPLITNNSGSARLTLGAPGTTATLSNTSSSPIGLSFTFSNSSTVVVNDIITGNIGGTSTPATSGANGTATGGLSIQGTGTLVLNAQNTYSGITNLTATAGSPVFQIATSTDTASSSTFTKGPFGTSTITPDSPVSGTQTFFQAISADQTVANPINMISGFTVSNAASGVHNLSLTGPITDSAMVQRTLTLTNTSTTAMTLTLGSAANPSTITLSPTGNINLSMNPAQNTTLVLNDVIQDSATPPATPDNITYNSTNNNTPMGTLQINSASTYKGNTTLNGETSGTVVTALVVQINVNSAGSPGSPTSGPFGQGTLKSVVSSSFSSALPAILEPFGADRTVANALDISGGGLFFAEPTLAQDATISNGPHNLSLTGPITLGTTGHVLTNNIPSGASLIMGSAASPSTITIASGLTLQTQGAAGAGGGSFTINDSIQNGTANGSLIVQNNAIVKLASASNGYSGGTTVKNGAQLSTVTSFSNGALTLTGGASGGAVATVLSQTTPGATTGVSILKSLSVDSASKLDITNNGLILASTATTPFSQIRTNIISGAASNFTGTGITSSTAAAVAANMSNPNKTAIGYANASDLGLVSGNLFLGKALTDNSAVLVRYTLAGDSNLDGIVNALDFNALATNYGTTSNGNWVQGDYNYDGSVDSNDFGFIAANFGANVVATGAEPLASAASLGTLVPEPTSISVLGISILALRRRRNA